MEPGTKYQRWDTVLNVAPASVATEINTKVLDRWTFFQAVPQGANYMLLFWKFDSAP